MHDWKDAWQEGSSTGQIHDWKDAAWGRTERSRHIGRLRGGWVKDRKYTGQEEWLRVRRKSGEEEKIMKGTLKAKCETSVFSYKRKSNNEGNSSTAKPVWPFITLAQNENLNDKLVNSLGQRRKVGDSSDTKATSCKHAVSTRNWTPLKRSRPMLQIRPSFVSLPLSSLCPRPIGKRTGSRSIN